MSRNARGRTTKKATGTISTYLFGFIALQVVCLMAFVSFAAINDFRRATSATAERAAADAARAAELIWDSTATARRTIVGEATAPGYAAVFDDPSRCTVTSSGAELFTEGQFHVLRPDGSVACSSTRPSGGIDGPGYAGQPWLGGIEAATEPVLAGPLVDPVSGRPSLIVAGPISEVPGSVVLSLDLASLGSGLDAELGVRSQRSSFLVTTSDRSVEVARSDGPISLELDQTPFVHEVAKGYKGIGVDGQERIFAEAEVPEVGWRVVAGISTVEAYADAWDGLRERTVFLALILIVVCAIGWAIHRRIGRPIRALIGAVEAAEDSVVSIVPEQGPNELRRLGKRFNRMLRERAESEVGLVEVFGKDERQAGHGELERMKSSFLLAISHELRTPLAVITGYADLLESSIGSMPDAELRELAHKVNAGASRLDRLLMDLLDVERLSRGIMEARRRPTHLHELVHRVLEFSEVRPGVEVDVPKSFVANVDPGLTERIVENLYRNAVKHTPKGTPIWIRAAFRNGKLELIVEDSGNGVPDDLKPEIFEVFRQGNTPDHGPGTGVGLSLVSQFARLHGGVATITDRPGGGARFTVTFTDAEVVHKKRRAAAKVPA